VGGVAFGFDRGFEYAVAPLQLEIHAGDLSTLGGAPIGIFHFDLTANGQTELLNNAFRQYEPRGATIHQGTQGDSANLVQVQAAAPRVNHVVIVGQLNVHVEAGHLFFLGILG
jgi:hypothetical protein